MDEEVPKHCGIVTDIVQLLTLGCARVRVVSQFTKCVVYLDPEEFHTTWCAMDFSHTQPYADKQTRFDSRRSFSALVRLGNKAIYRTRMAMKTGGELIVLAPGKNAERSQLA